MREKTFDPSSGGIGIRLKIAKSKFIRTIVNRILGTMVAVRKKFGIKIIIFKRSAAKTAIKIFVRGPARETMATSFLPSLRLNWSTGTGLAAPKITGEPDKSRRRGSKMLIKGSIWFFGFKVSLPISLAVGSPSRSATSP